MGYSLSLERVVSWLTSALLNLNCSVTLFASGNSRTRARLVAVCPQALRLPKPPIDPAVATSATVRGKQNDNRRCLAVA